MIKNKFSVKPRNARYEYKKYIQMVLSFVCRDISFAEVSASTFLGIYFVLEKVSK